MQQVTGRHMRLFAVALLCVPLAVVPGCSEPDPTERVLVSYVEDREMLWKNLSENPTPLDLEILAWMELAAGNAPQITDRLLGNSDRDVLQAAARAMPPSMERSAAALEKLDRLRKTSDIYLGLQLTGSDNNIPVPRSQEWKDFALDNGRFPVSSNLPRTRIEIDLQVESVASRTYQVILGGSGTRTQHQEKRSLRVTVLVDNEVAWEKKGEFRDAGLPLFYTDGLPHVSAKEALEFQRECRQDPALLALVRTGRGPLDFQRGRTPARELFMLAYGVMMVGGREHGADVMEYFLKRFPKAPGARTAKKCLKKWRRSSE